MDLVASYSSDESENDAYAHSLMKNTVKSDSVISATVNIATSLLQDINYKCSSLEIASVEKGYSKSFSASDSENDIQTKLISTNPNQSSTIHYSPEKVDYLNLESSDTDDECPNSHTRVETLLSSAAILNDIELGPVKPSTELNPTLAIASNVLIPYEVPLQQNCSKKRCNSPESITSTEILDCVGPKKHFKSNSDAIEPDLCSNEEKCFSKEFFYREDELVMAHYYKKAFCQIPKKVSKNYDAHTNLINSLSWCSPQFSHLFLSASTDCSLKVWDMFSNNFVQCIKCNSGLKAAKWLKDGKKIVTGGYGKKAHIFDVISGKEIIQYDVGNCLTSLEIHPNLDDVILCGTENAVFGFDTRVNQPEPIRTFTSKCNEVLDIVFLNESEFACSTNIISRDSANRTIMVWDFSSGALFSNQIYLERYTCPSLKVHPSGSRFVAQTNGDYIAYFSTSRPYKIQNKRCMGHKVSGYGVECDISLDGKYIASGDANGDIYFYDFYTTNFIHKLTAKSKVAVNRLKWHPVLYSTMVTATWDGSIQIWR